MTKKEQIYNHLITWITENNEKNFIPSEKALQIKFGFSRNTIRSAINHLCELDVLIPVKGKGHKINNLKPNSLHSYVEQYDAYDHDSVFIKTINHNDWNEKLKVKSYVEIIKIRYKNKVPFILTYQFVPEYIFNSFKDDLYKKTLYGAIEKSGETIAFARKKTTYMKAPGQVRTFMHNIEKWTLLLESLTFNKSNRVIEHSLNYYDPETYTWEWTEKKI